MLILQILLFILAILFAIWLYMLVLCENPPGLKRIFYPCIKWCQDHSDNLFFSTLKLIIAKLYKALEWVFSLIAKIFKFIIHVLVEALGEAILYVLFIGIIAIFVFIYKYVTHH